MYLVDDQHALAQTKTAHETVPYRQCGYQHLVHRTDADLSEEDALAALR